MKRAENVERRALLKGLAAGIAGTVASPLTSTTAAAHEPAAPPAGTVEQPAPAAPPPRFLDDHQRRTLTSLAETIMPGATAAGTVDLIDRVSAVDGPPRQRQLLNALGRFDAEARAAGADRWIDLAEAARLDILRRVSGTTPADHFVYIRTTVTNAYLATEAGMKDFGWAGRTAWKELPGCAHPNPAHE